MRKPKFLALNAVALATCPNETNPNVCPISLGKLESNGRPSDHLPSLTYLSIVNSLLYVAKISMIV